MVPSLSIFSSLFANRLFYRLGLARLLLAAGGRKDDVVDYAPTSTSNLSLEDFTRRNGVYVQTFSLIPNLGAKASGFLLSRVVPTSIFLTSGFILPSGMIAAAAVKLRVREIYSMPW